MKLIILRPYIKLHKKIHNIAQNYTAKCTTCCAIKFCENLNFLCVLVLLNRDIPLTWSAQIALSNVQHSYCALFVALSVAHFIALYVALNLYTFYLKFCCVSP